VVTPCGRETGFLPIRVEHCIFHAIVGRESTDHDLFDALLVKLRGETSFIERRVTVSVAEALGDHGDARIVTQVGMKLGALSVLHAVDGPCAAISSKMFCRRWMPVATFVDRLTTRQKLVNEMIKRCDHLIAIGDSQRATGTKIVLHIDH
jgi:hypothetical protein